MNRLLPSLLIIVLAASYICSPATALCAGPNVVILLFDDQGWTDYGFMGHPTVQTQQIDFAYHLAREIRSLGGQRLPVLVDQWFGRPLTEITTVECSRLIDALKSVPSGTRSVDERFSETSA